MLSFIDPRASILDVAAGRCWTAAEIEAEAARRAEMLGSWDVRFGTRVAIIQENSVSFFCDLFAAWSLGAAAACLDPALTDAEVKTVLEFLKPAAVAPASGWSGFLASPPVEARQRLAPQHDSPRRAARAPQNEGGWTIDEPALILFTSGTTASPKAVVLSYRAVLTRLSWNRLAIGDDALRRALVTLPVHFGHGLIGNALTPLAAGGMIVLTDRGLPLAAGLGRIVDEHGITFMSSVPAFWRMALKLSKPPAGGTLERVHVGSAPLSGDLWARIVAWTGCEVVNCYGMTETANWFAGASSADGCTDNAVGTAWGGRAGVIGADRRIHATGEGEIVVLSPSVMSGFLDRPDLTRTAFAQGWYRTGDSGIIDAAGRIVLTGRLKDEINRGGQKIQPADVDQVVARHPDVVEACTFAIPDAASGEIVGIAVQLSPDTSADVAALRAWCADRLRREAIPERWFVVTEIPKTARGKVNREQVRRIVMERN